MPLYEYFCRGCDHKFELIRPSSQSKEGASCPRCDGTAERVLSSFACFSRGSDGEPVGLGGASSCGTCSTTGCSSCGG